MNIANKWADGEESMQYELVPVKVEPGASRIKDQDDNWRKNGRNSDRRRKRKEQSTDEADGMEFVAAEFSGRRDDRPRKQGGDWRRGSQDSSRQARPPVQLDDPCTFHTFRNKKGEITSSHTLRNCRRFQELIQLTGTTAPVTQAPVEDANAPPAPADGGTYTPPRGSMMIHKGCVSKRGQKAASRQAYLATVEPPATPEYLNWSEGDIRFSRADHPPKIPRPGHSALIVGAQIGGYNVSRVFMDGGSGINIIFADTLRRMKVPL